jgi:MFS family permease
MRRLLAGQTISRFGDQFYFVALPWLVLRASDSPIALALVTGTAAAALGVFTLLGGVLADRFGARGLMLTADVFRLLIVSGLAAAVLVGTLPLWALVALSGLLGAGGGLFYPASAAMIPHLVPPDDLQAANGFDQLTMQTSNFVGPSVAGVVLATTRLAFGFLIDALSFAVSVVSLVAIRMPRRRPQPATPTATAGQDGQLAHKGGMGEAIRFLRASPFLLTLLGVSLVANFAIGGLPEVALPLLLKHWVGLTEGPRALGIVIGGFGLGSVIGAIIASMATRIPHKPLVGVLTVLPTGAMLGAAPYLGGVNTLAAIFGAVGLLLAISNVLFATVLQRFIPLEMMGRVMSISMLGSFVGTPLSIFAYGAIATVVPDVTYLFVAGGALLVIACLFSLARNVIWQTM